MQRIESQTIEEPRLKSTEAPQEAAFAEEEIKKEPDPLLKKTHIHFRELLNVVDKVNQEMIKQEKLPVVSQQETKDIEMHSGRHMKELFRYWTPRLTPEIDILPRPIGHIVKKLSRGNRIYPGEYSKFQRYINKRTGILRFNMEKRLEMAQLKQRLQAIDKQEDYPEKEHKNRKTVFYNEGNHELFVYENKEKKKVTFGDIVADYEWGIQYRPDKSVPRNIWRKIRKLSDITEARSNIERIFNHELFYIERIGLPTTAISTEFLEKVTNPGLRIGAVAERMAKNFLTRAQHNNDFNFQVENSNALEDVKFKYDFKITIPEKIRGIAIEGKEMSRKELVAAKRRIGIQFTINQTPAQLKRKEKKIEKGKQEIKSDAKYLKFIKKPVDDIVLVSLPLETYDNYFKKWLDNDKPSGGPEQYLTDEEKVRIFKAVTKNFIDLSDEQIQQLAL